MTTTITTPVSYRVFQRNGSNQGSIAITGTYSGGTPTAIEASFNGGAYATIDAAPSGGNYSGTLSGQAQGQGTLTVRWVNTPSDNASVTYIGIGDIYIIAGQSNACGETTDPNPYYHPTLRGGLFGNDYNWKQLADDVDSNVGQVDTVSSDAAGGSLYPVLATYLMQHQNVPVAFVPCAKVGSPIVDWQPGANHQDRTTLYGSMCYRALQTGAKMVIWWQGETDAVNATTEANYNAYLDTLANAIQSDLGVKLMPCKLEILNESPWTSDVTPINNAITTAWGDNSNVLTGPDFSDWTMTDWAGIHYGNDVIYMVASRWFQAIQKAFGWTPQNHCLQSNSNWEASNTAVVLRDSVGSGHTLVAIVTQYGGTAINATSISDNHSNTWNLIGSITSYSGDSSFRMGFYYAYNVASGATTVTCTANGTPTMTVLEYDGFLTTDPLDKQTTAQATSGTSISSGNTATTAQADEVAVGAAGLYTGTLDFFQPGTNYALREGWPNPTNQNDHVTEDRTLSSTGAYAATFTQNQDNGWIAKIATFKLASTGQTYEESVTLSRTLSVTQPLAGGTNENASMAVHLGIGIVDQVVVQGAVSLAKFVGVNRSENANVNEATSLAKFVGVSGLSQVNVNDGTTLAKFTGVTVSEYRTVSESVTLSRSLGEGSGDLANVIDATTLAEFKGVSAATNVNVIDATSLAKFDGVTSLETKNVPESTTLARFLGLTAEGARPGTEESVSLAKFLGVTSLSQVSIQDSATLAKFIGESGVTLANVFDLVSLQRSDTLTVSEEKVGALEETVTLAKFAGISAATQTNEKDATTLAKFIGIASGTQTNEKDSVTLTKGLGLTADGQRAGGIDETVTLTKSLGVAAASQVQADNGVSLAKFVGVVPAGQISISDGTTLTKSLAVSSQTQVSVFDGVTITRTAVILTATLANVGNAVTLQRTLALSFAEIQTGPYTGIVELDLYTRSFDLNVESREFTLDPLPRSFDLDPEDREHGE